MLRWNVILVIAGVGTIAFGGALPVHALSMKECSAKYKAAESFDRIMRFTRATPG